MKTQCCGVVYTAAGNPQRCSDCPYTVPPQPVFYINASQGWECPRCRKINAPTVTQCNCTPTGIKWTFQMVGGGNG